MTWSKEVKKAYMSNYYRKHKAAYQKRYRDWCEANPNESRAKRGKEKRTPEELKAYRRQYYIDHKDRYRQKYSDWCKKHPGDREAANQRWRKRNPFYYRDYMRERIKVVDPLAFQFLDSGFDRDVNEYTDYLRSKGTPEQHIGWFKKDIQKFMEGGE